MKKENIKKYARKYWQAIIIIILLLFNIGFFFKAQNLKDEISDTKVSYAVERQDFEKLVNSKGDTIYQQALLITSQREAIEQELITKQELRDMGIRQAKQIVKLKEQMQILRDSIEYSTPPEIIIVVDSTGKDTINYLRIPIGFSKSTEWWSLTGTVDKKIRIDTLSFYSEPNIYIGFKDKGFLTFFKKREQIVSIGNNNPNIVYTNIMNVNFEEKKWYDKKGYVFLGGFISGTLITTLITAYAR